MAISEQHLNRLISNSIAKVILSENAKWKGGFDPHHPANRIELGYDKNLRYGTDWQQNGGNFMVRRNGHDYYVSRNTSVSLYAFAKDTNGEWYILANQRGRGSSKGLYNVTCGFVDMAANGRPEETLEQAACREAFEENGVRINPTGLVMLGVNSRNRNINASFYTVIEDRTIEQMPTSISHSEPGETTDSRWIPLSEVDQYDFAFNQNQKIHTIALKALGDYQNNGGSDRIGTLIAMLRKRLGDDQESQYLLKQIVQGLSAEKNPQQP